MRFGRPDSSVYNGPSNFDFRGSNELPISSPKNAGTSDLKIYLHGAQNVDQRKTFDEE